MTRRSAKRALGKMRADQIAAAKQDMIDDAAVFGYALPAGRAGRSAGKALVREGLLEPNGCLGYRLTDTARAERFAYTLGTATDYDGALTKWAPVGEFVRKRPGGTVWRTMAEAEAWQRRPGNEALAVYTVVLPGAWSECTRVDGEHHGLTVAAVIVTR